MAEMSNQIDGIEDNHMKELILLISDFENKHGKEFETELRENPFYISIWKMDELVQFNLEYEVSKYAPGYFGFGTSGGGEMFSFAPTGKIVCLQFIGMNPKEALYIADSWEDLLRTMFEK